MDERWERSRVVVYLHGVHKRFKWYRVELPMAEVKKRKRPEASPTPREIVPAAKMYGYIRGRAACWNVIGDDIYYIGGYRYTTEGKLVSYTKRFLKHNITDPDPAIWLDASPRRTTPRKSPFVAALNNKLCAVAGDGYFGDEKCGEVYDLDTRSWTSLDAKYSKFGPYTDMFTQVAQDVVDPTRVVFYDMGEGTTLFLDVTNGNSEGVVTHDNFALRVPTSKDPALPLGLRNDNEVAMLQVVSVNVRAVFAKGTFYWCGPHDLCLYAYDIVLKRWLRSKSLLLLLPSFRFNREDPRFPILLGLPNGKLVLCLTSPTGLLTVALLTVDKEAKSLHVSVDLVRLFYFDDLSFVPLDGKAMLKNAASASMH